MPRRSVVEAVNGRPSVRIGKGGIHAGLINEVKRRNVGLALEWKLALRRVLAFYLSRGYIVVEHIPHVEDGERRNFYLLWRGSLGKVLSGEYPWK